MLDSFKEILNSECDNPMSRPEKMEVMPHNEMMDLIQQQTKGSLYDDRKALMESPYYQKWLAKHQERNRFIGSEFIQAAPEHGTDAVEAEPVKVKTLPGQVVNSEGVDIVVGDTSTVDKESEEIFEKNEAEQKDDEVLNEDAKRMAENMLDYCVIANTRKLLPFDVPMDDLMGAIDKALKEYHEDDEYECKLDIGEALKDIETEAFKRLSYSAMEAVKQNTKEEKQCAV